LYERRQCLLKKLQPPKVSYYLRKKLYSIYNKTHFFLIEKEIEISDSDSDYNGEEVEEGTEDEGEEGEGEDEQEAEEEEEGEEADSGYGSIEPDVDYEPPPKKGGSKRPSNSKGRGTKRPLAPSGTTVKPATKKAAGSGGAGKGKPAPPQAKPAPPQAKSAATGGGAKKKKGGAGGGGGAKDEDAEWNSTIDTEDKVVRDFSIPKREYIKEKFKIG
jgi:hypothetical protein